MKSPFFNEDHEMIRDLAREFAEGELKDAAVEMDKTEEFPQEILDAMGEMGLFGLEIPEEYGGAGMDVRSYVCVMEEIAKHCASAAVFVSGFNSLGSAPILMDGTEEQKQKYLPGIASGKEFMAFGLTEPNAGSDAGSMTTSAVVDPSDPDYYIINGRKCFITGAPIATNCLVYAKTSPEKGSKGITCFIVGMDQEGVSVGKHEEKMGQRANPTSDVILEDVRVHKDQILGTVDEGFMNALKTLSLGRVGVSSLSIGMAQGAMDLAVEHMKERKQFGKPLAKFQALQFKMAEAETKLNAARLLTYNAAYLLDMQHEGEKVDPTKDAAMAKFFAADTAIEVISTCLQMFGGYGYSREYPIERIYRDVRVNSIYEGSSEIQKIVIAGKLFK
ncbi:MAG: acyl-CoA dehydrogenase family protein [Oscillospiraceae bacterium]|nr:acyl-CoA dehydrogenase family protein [Oscillospiraceae bacterium]